MNCIICEKEFTGRADAKYCSAGCRKKASRGSTDNAVNKSNNKRLCENCKKPIVDARPMERFHHACWRKEVDKINETLKSKGLPTSVPASELEPITFIKSGIAEIDALITGFPRKRITEIFGLKGVGKTTLMKRIAGALDDNISVYYVDAENAMEEIASGSIELLAEDILEKVEEAVEVIIQSNQYDLIVVDSVAALVPWAEMEGEAGEAHMGLKARLMGQWMRKINHWLKDSNTAIVFINQQRETMAQFTAKRFTPGGFALGYAASLRLELRSNKADKKENHQLVTVIVEKSRFSKPYEKTEFKLKYK